MKKKETKPEENSTRRKKLIFWSIVIIFFYALGLRLAYIESAFIVLPIRADAEKYVTIAENLVNHGAYSTEQTPPFHPHVLYTPGYPLFLASILKLTPDFVFAYVTIQRIQALLSAITAVIVFLIGLELLPLWGAFLAGCLMVISPHAVIMSGYLLTETLFTFLLYSALFCAIKGFRNNSLGWFAWFAILAALGTLVRPALLLFPFLVAFLIWFYLPQKTRLKAGCSMLLIFILLQAPWFAWKLTYTAKNDLSLGATSLALGTYPDLIYKDPELRGKPYKDDPESDKMSRSTKATIKILLQRTAKDPWTYIKWYLFEKPVMFWSWETIVGTGGPFIYQVASCIYFNYTAAAYSMLFSKWMHPILLVSACFTVLSLFVGFLKRDQPNCSGPGILIVALLSLYFTAIHSVLAPLPRYSIPVHGCLFLLGTCGFVFIVSFARKQYVNKRQYFLQ